MFPARLLRELDSVKFVAYIDTSGFHSQWNLALGAFNLHVSQLLHPISVFDWTYRSLTETPKRYLGLGAVERIARLPDGAHVARAFTRISQATVMHDGTHNETLPALVEGKVVRRDGASKLQVSPVIRSCKVDTNLATWLVNLMTIADADATYVWSGALARCCDLLAKDCTRFFSAALFHGTPYMYILIQKNHGYSITMSPKRRSSLPEALGIKNMSLLSTSYHLIWVSVQVIECIFAGLLAG
ncbi:hypothetical protein AB1N83_003925 [Pleurotus pulmonarius]